MDRLFGPRAIAVIGASPDESKLPGRPLNYLRRYGFAGGVYPVNPKYGELGGRRCFASIAELPDDTDLALIMLPAPGVADALEALGRKGTAYAISVASGFAEAEQPERQQRLAAICRETGIRLIGPNCVGFINPGYGVTATFSTVIGRAMPPAGGLAVVTQSGALGNALLQNCNELGIGLRCWVSVGNEADLGALDFVQHLLDDEGTTTIALFLEGLKQGDRLLSLGRAARAHGKRIVVLRAGQSDVGRRASISHTGKLAGSARVWRHVARQAGMWQVETLDDLVDMCLALQVWGSPSQAVPPGLGVLTISGGLGVLISDFCAERRIPVPCFVEVTQSRLRALLPPQMAVANPVDTALFADEKGYEACARAVIEDPSVGTLLLILTSLAHDYDTISRRLGALAAEGKQAGRRIAVSFLSSADQMTAGQRERMRDAGVLVLSDALRVANVLAGLAFLAKPLPEPASSPEGQAALMRTEGDLLAAARIPSPAEIVCRTAAEAAEAARHIARPVALKISSPDLPHKTEVGGVVLGLREPEAVATAFEAMLRDVRQRAPAARIDGAVVQEMVEGGLEFIAGVSTDPELGKVVMLGTGGVLAEVLDDVTFRAPPLTSEDVEEMLGELKGSRLLDGYRGAPKADRGALVDAVLGLARVVLGNPRIVEVDINPLAVLPEGRGVRALDCVVVLDAEPRREAAQ